MYLNYKAKVCEKWILKYQDNKQFLIQANNNVMKNIFKVDGQKMNQTS